MLAPKESTESITKLIGQAVEDAREVARAEVDVYRQAARVRLQRSKVGLAMIGAAAVLALAAVIALLVGFVLGLEALIGGVAAGLVVAGVTFAIAFVLIRMGLPKLAAVPAHPADDPTTRKSASHQGAPR